MFRRISASYWTAGAAFVVMTALHLRWLFRSLHAGDVLSAYGAGLVALGLPVPADAAASRRLNGGMMHLVPRNGPVKRVGLAAGRQFA